MITRQSNPKPNKWKKGIGQPVHPPQTRFLASVWKQKIHPYIKQLIRTQPREEVRLENSVFQMTAPNVVVSFERSDTPSEWSLRKHYSGTAMRNLYGPVVQRVSDFESASFRKPCKRSLNPVGSSKTRSSPVITSIFRVLS